MKTLTLLLLLFTSQVFANQYTNRLKQDLAEYVNHRKAGNLTFQDLYEFKNSNNIRSIDEFLSKFPFTHDLYAVGMGRSRSLQDASLKNPRIILFTESTDLILTFNGDASQSGYESIEVMQFNWEKLEYELFRLVFDQDLQDRLRWLRSANQKTSDLSLALRELETINSIAPEGLKNPSVCMGCHKGQESSNEIKLADPQPNWNPYSIWPDALISGFIKYGDTHPETGLKISKKEAIAFENEDRDYQSYTRYNRLSEYQLKNLHKEEGSFGSPVPILIFSEHLNFLNSLRAYRIMSEHPEFEVIRKKMVHLIWDCYSSDSGKYRREGLALRIRELLTEYNFDQRLFTTNFIYSEHNKVSAPGFILRTLIWVFGRDIIDSEKVEFLSFTNSQDIYYLAPHFKYYGSIGLCEEDVFY